MPSTADHTVDHDTAKPRAMEAGVPSTASTRSVAHSAALVVSSRRGSANSVCSVQVLTSQSGSGQRQTRLRHRIRTIRRPAGTSRSVTHRRSFGMALVPQPEQPTSRCVVSTSITSSVPSSMISSTWKPDRAEPQRTTVDHQGLLYLGPSDSHEIRGGPSLSGGSSPPGLIFPLWRARSAPARNARSVWEPRAVTPPTPLPALGGQSAAPRERPGTESVGRVREADGSVRADDAELVACWIQEHASGPLACLGP